MEKRKFGADYSPCEANPVARAASLTSVHNTQESAWSTLHHLLRGLSQFVCTQPRSNKCLPENNVSETNK